MRQALEIGQLDGFALFCRQILQRAANFAEHFLLRGFGFEIERQHHSVLDQLFRFARIAAAQARDGAIARGDYEPSGDRAARWIKLRGVAPDLEEDILQNFFGGLGVAKNAIQNSAEQAGIAIVECGESGLVAGYDAFDQRPIGGALVCGCCCVHEASDASLTRYAAGSAGGLLLRKAGVPM